MRRSLDRWTAPVSVVLVRLLLLITSSSFLLFPAHAWSTMTPLSSLHHYRSSSSWQPRRRRHCRDRPVLFSEPFSSVTPTTTSTSTSDDSRTTTWTTTSNARTRYLSVKRVDRAARWPVWPVWSGVMIWILEQVLGPEQAARYEHAWAGRVGPQFLAENQMSPFLLLVHHVHSFAPWDVVRWIQRRFILPEGFPAHPHRGFITLTYFLHGGFRHRDSLGVRQDYGADAARYGGVHSQWLHTGSGLLHEEMFDHNDISAGPAASWWAALQPRRQELYQLWINLPAAYKMTPPYSLLLGGPDRPTPTVTRLDEETGGRTTTLVLAGSYQKVRADVPLASPLAVFHVTLTPHATWTYTLDNTYDSLLLYVRLGEVSVPDGGRLAISAAKKADTTLLSSAPTGEELGWVTAHATAYLWGGQASDQVWIQAGPAGADVLFLAGQALREPVAAAGPMVMNTQTELEQARQDYQLGWFGRPWDHALSDEAWRAHLAAGGRALGASADSDPSMNTPNQKDS